MFVGRAFTDRPSVRALAILVGLCTVAADFALIHAGHGANTMLRLGLAIVAGLLLLLLARGDLDSVGFRIRPTQGWRVWIRITTKIAVVLGILIGCAAVVLWATHSLGTPPMLSPQEYGPRMLWACATVPWFEEGIYRLALCAPLATQRRWPVILLSGVVFALLHVAYGNPGPDNFLAGFVLAWAYLHSGSIVVPIVLHAFGNAFALTLHLVTWYAA